MFQFHEFKQWVKDILQSLLLEHLLRLVVYDWEDVAIRLVVITLSKDCMLIDMEDTEVWPFLEGAGLYPK